MPCRHHVLISILYASLLLVSCGCDSKKASRLADQEAARRATVRELLTEEEQVRIADLFATSPLMDEILAPDEDRKPRRTVDLVVAKIKELREQKNLALSTSMRPSGSRPASELARLLVSPSPIIEADLPTDDIELTALAVATLHRHGVEASPAVQIAQSDDTQLEHLVLAVSFDGKPHEFFELTREGVPEGARFDLVTEVEVLGLHLARRAALLFLLDHKVMAKQDLTVAFKLAPSMATPYYVRASMTDDLDPAQTTRDLSQVLLRKDSPEVWLRIGRALRLQGHHDNARAILSQIPEASALHAEAQIEFAQSACTLGDKDAFMFHVIAAISAKPRLWEAYRDMAIVGIVHEEHELVEEAIREGIRAAPDVHVWQLLSQAHDPDAPMWHEGLMTRREMLGACAQDLEPVPSAQPAAPASGEDRDL